MQSASREPLAGRAALGALEGVTKLFVAKGKRVLQIDLASERPPDEELLELLLGRSGKLRAPTIRVGDRLLVGFNQEMLESQLL